MFFESFDMKDNFEGRLQRVQGFLERTDFNGFTRKDLLLPAWHSIVTLSNMAEAITNLFIKEELSTEEAIDYLNSNNIKSIIIDHHEINKPYPKSDVIINPKKNNGYEKYN